jgi:hypothetical protein
MLKENEIKSPYDLKETLWFIIPGATLIVLIFLFESWFAVQIRGMEIKGYTAERHTEKLSHMPDTTRRHEIKYNLEKKLHTPIYTALSLSFGGETKFKDNWVIAAVFLLILLSICYVLGHILYMIGTFIYENGLVSKGYSYPYLKLLDLPRHPTKSVVELEASQSFYKGIYFWISVLYLLSYVLLTQGGNDKLHILYYFILSLLYILLIFIPIRFKFILGYITEWKENPKGRPRPYIGGKRYWTIITAIICLPLFWTIPFIHEKLYYFLPIFFLSIIFIEADFRLRTVKKSKLAICCARSLLRLKRSDIQNEHIKIITEYDKEKVIYETFFIKLYNFFGNEADKFFNNYLRTQDNFDPVFINKYNAAFRKTYKSNPSDLIRQNHWLSKFYVMENSVYMNQQIHFWENVYIFTKTLSAAFFIAFVYCSMSFMLQYKAIRSITEPVWDIAFKYDSMILFLIPIVYFFITALMIRYYLYVYDNRYNRMILRSFVAITSKE